METQRIGFYENLDSEDEGNKIYVNDLSRIYVNAKRVALVPRTNTDASDERGNMHMAIIESQPDESLYEEIHVQN